MAKRRLLKTAAATAIEPAIGHEPAPLFSSSSRLAAGLAVGLAGSIGVYVGYYPSDSVSVDNGDALWLAVLSLLWLSAVAATHWSKRPWDRTDMAACGLACWMMAAAFLNSDHSDLRMGTNEAWWWVSAVAMFLAARRVLASPATRSSFVLLAICVSIGLAVDASYQQWVSLPETKASYQQDPDKLIAQLGIDAPPGSAARMVLENRLFDGGPTATFALANSLAAVLVLGIVFVSGVLRMRWSELTAASRFGFMTGVLVLVPALFAVRSRAALLATLVGLLMLVLVTPTARSGRLSAVLPRLFGGLAAIVGLGMVGLLGLARFGNPEWIAAAPASLSFRLQYWSATWRMMGQHYWLGSGPGNFQAIYDRYRSDDMIESIADPHNFILETLTSGGPVALALLIVVIAGSVLVLRRRWKTPSSNPFRENGSDDWLSDNAVILFGGIAMLVAIWFFGFLTRHSPDLDSHRFAIPTALVVGWMIRRAAFQLDSKQLDCLFGIGVAAMLLHLSVSGGWTVPGIAFWGWTLLAGLARYDATTDSSRKRSPAFVAISLVALVALIVLSLRPVTQRNAAIAIANDAVRKRNPVQALRWIDQAVQSDTWSHVAAMMQTEFLYRELVRQNNRIAVRKAYLESVAEVQCRTPPSPSIHRQWAGQRLHLYQVFGDAADLADAKTFLQSARQDSPADQWIAAQLAEVYMAEGDLQSAKKIAKSAETLSNQGSNLERSLYLQLVYKLRSPQSKPYGVEAASGPIRVSAESLFEERSLLAPGQ